LSVLSLPLTLLYPLPLKIVVDSVLGTQPLPAWLVKTVPMLQARGTALEAAIAVLLGIALLVGAQALFT